MKRHALFVGVNDYADPTIQNLAFPTEDATELASVFRRLLKFDRVEKLTNPAHSPEVVDAVKDMTRGLGPGDFFLFFFAGHGFRVKENHVLVCARDEYVDLEDEYAGLPVGRLKKRMRGPWNRMLVLDACQNDIRATRGADCGVAARDIGLIHSSDDGAPGAGLQIVVTACSEEQKALEVADLGHGLFTSAFLDSVTAFADARRRIDLESLRTDLGGRMGQLIAQYRLSGKQEPMFTMPTDAGGIVLLDGVASTSSTPPFGHVVSVQEHVVCPVCGKKNDPKDTFKCRKCGRDNLCLRHQDEATFLCAECIAAKRRELDEATRKAEVERRAREAREAALRNGTCREAGISRSITLPGGAKMEMIYCPPGEFMMGSPNTEEDREDNETQHCVRLTKGFWIGKYPVTQQQWKSVMGSNPSNWEGDDLPVENVSWNDCQEFVSKLNETFGNGVARLPTEAEWEYACRAGTTTAYSFVNVLNGDKANCDGNYPYGTTKKGKYIGRTTSIGQYDPNFWGFYDMHGNVWEWCADWYGDYPSGSVTDPIGPASGDYRVLRGGGWSSITWHCRSAYRNWHNPGNRNYYYGFRLSCSVGPRGLGAEP